MTAPPANHGTMTAISGPTAAWPETASGENERRDEPSPWLFSRTVDLAAFLAPAAVALGLVAAGAKLGLLHRETPEWTWVAGVLLVDVAHVYATTFRLYFDPTEIRRHLWLSVLTPLLAFAIGWALYTEGAAIFWRSLAYLAVFHFVRQQYGWVALYRAKCGERDRLGWWIDSLAIYLATLYPLVWWHAHLPRTFWWFRSGDFGSVPPLLATILEPVYWASLAVYLVRSLVRGMRWGFWNPGKDIVVCTTTLCWHIGIISLDSDFAFTVTNVLIHGVPYFVLVYWHRWKRRPAPVHPHSSGRWAATILIFLATVWLLAYAEELLWDRGVWHEREWLFGSGWEAGGWESILVPLLAAPQITHYVVDGVLWRRRSRSTAL